MHPDGTFLYVTNHQSDNISVVDLDLGAVTRTIEQVDSATRLSVLDEPCGVAFSPTLPRAYVTLSQPNRLAVIDTDEHTIHALIDLPGEDPRAVVVSPDGERVFVAAFESGNHTEIELPGESDIDKGAMYWWYTFLNFIIGAGEGEIDFVGDTPASPIRTLPTTTSS